MPAGSSGYEYDYCMTTEYASRDNHNLRYTYTNTISNLIGVGFPLPAFTSSIVALVGLASFASHCSMSS